MCRGAHGGTDSSSVTESGTHLLDCIVEIREMLARLEIPNVDIVVCDQGPKLVLAREGYLEP